MRGISPLGGFEFPPSALDRKLGGHNKPMKDAVTSQKGTYQREAGVLTRKRILEESPARTPLTKTKCPDSWDRVRRQNHFHVLFLIS